MSGFRRPHARQFVEWGLADALQLATLGLPHERGTCAGGGTIQSFRFDQQSTSVSCYAVTGAVIATPDVELLKEFRRLKRFLHHGSLSRTIWRVAVGPARERKNGVGRRRGYSGLYLVQECFT